MTLEEAKLHLKVDVADDDTLINNLIIAARQKCEEYTRRAFITQVWEVAYDDGRQSIVLPKQPIQSIESVTLDGEVISPDSYKLISNTTLYFKISCHPVEYSGLVIRYKAGYGDTPDSVPQAIRQAILMLVAHLYENRQGEAPAANYEIQARKDIPYSVAALLQPYRVMML